MLRTASIRLQVTPEQAARLSALRTAYAEACNRLVPLVQAERCWNRVALHRLGYRRLRQETALGAQMACNAIFSVCKAYRSQRARGRIVPDTPVPPLCFTRASVHFDPRTYTLRGEAVSLNTLQGRIVVPMILGEHQRRILASGLPKEAELVFRRGHWFFHLVVESADGEAVASGPVMGVDVVRFECSCGFRAHADWNASRNLARIGETAVSPRAAVDTPDVGRVAGHASS